MARTTPSFKGLKPASERASRAARGSSKKTDTKPEKLLRSALWKAGLRFRKNVKDLPGKPDIVFTKARVAVFVDGDFWHGNLRPDKYTHCNNSSYWILKIRSNMQRDAGNDAALLGMGWTVYRFWESSIVSDLDSVVRSLLSSPTFCHSNE